MNRTGPVSAVTLTALRGAPLEDEALRDLVIATARAIAERQGVAVLEIAATDRSITVTLAAGRLVSLGLAAELRATTSRWYTRKHGEATLWGEPAGRPWTPPGSDE